MKTTVFENKFGLDINIEPETPEEVAALARFALNAKAERPNVYMGLDEKPYLSLWMRKNKRLINSIKPYAEKS